MMSKKSPQLRFEDFTDDWEQRKLKDIFDVHTDFVSNGSFQALKENVQLYKTENYAYMIRLQDASNNWDGPWLYTDKQGFDFLDKSTVYKDDILMSDRGTIGKFFLVPQLDKPMTLSSNAVLLRSTKNDNNFIYYMLNTSNISNQIIVRTTPGVQPMISKTEFKKINTCIPNIEEQQKIGSFFQQLDETIALHQRKLDLLKEQKKGYLQKMFPKNGAKVPELRFAGFANDWEQRKLGDLAEIKDSARIPNIKWQKEGVPYLRSSDLSSEHIKDGLFLSLADYIKYDKITGSPKKGDLIFASGGDIGLAIYKYDSLPIYVQGGSILYVKTSKCENLDGLFLKYSFASPKVKKYIRNASTGTSLKHFVLKPANALPISYPDLIEQEKIGSLLMQMDRTITLHQRKLDLLKEQKKGLLQKMFV